MLIAYIFRKTSNDSSLWFIANKNFGDSGININAIELNRFIKLIQMTNSRHGVNLRLYMKKLKSNGISTYPKSDAYINTNGMNIEVNEAARGAFSWV